MLSYEGVSKGFFDLVLVPRSQGYRTIRRHSRETGWASNILFFPSGYVHEEVTSLYFLSYFARSGDPTKPLGRRLCEIEWISHAEDRRVNDRGYS